MRFSRHRGKAGAASRRPPSPSSAFY
jgi:hypothetical protein